MFPWITSALQGVEAGRLTREVDAMRQIVLLLYGAVDVDLSGLGGSEMELGNGR